MASLRSLWTRFRKAPWEVRLVVIMLLLLVTARQLQIAYMYIRSPIVSDWHSIGFASRVAIAILGVGMCIGLLFRSKLWLWISASVTGCIGVNLIGFILILPRPLQEASPWGIYVVISRYVDAGGLTLIPILLVVTYCRGTYLRTGQDKSVNDPSLTE